MAATGFLLLMVLAAVMLTSFSGAFPRSAQSILSHHGRHFEKRQAKTTKPATTKPPPTTTKRPPTTTTRPPTTTKPPPTTTKPPTTTTPPPTTTQPQPTSTQPPPTSTQPPPTSTEAPTTTPPLPQSDSGCVYNGTHYENGEDIEEDHCSVKYCEDGRLGMTTIRCEIKDDGCNVNLLPSDCCPLCEPMPPKRAPTTEAPPPPGCYENGEFYEYGEIISKGPCGFSFCAEWGIGCGLIVCDSGQCNRENSPDDCCPVCEDMTTPPPPPPPPPPADP